MQRFLNERMNTLQNIIEGLHEERKICIRFKYVIGRGYFYNIADIFQVMKHFVLIRDVIFKFLIFFIKLQVCKHKTEVDFSKIICNKK